MKKYLKLKFSFDLILEYGIYLFAFLLPLQTRLFLKRVYVENIYWEYASFSLYLIDILIIFLLLISTIVIFKKRNATHDNLDKVWFLFGFLEFFVFISIFFADIKYIAIYGYIKVLLALAVFFLVSEIKYNNKYFNLSFLLGVFIQSIIAILQHIYNFSFANEYLGMAVHDPSVLGTFVLELEDGTRFLRSYAGLDHPNIFAFYSFLGIFLFVKIILNIKSLKNFSASKQFFCLSVLAMFFYSFLLSFSRSAYLLFVFYILFLLIWSFFNKNRRALIYKIVFSFFLVFLVFLNFSHSLLLQRLSFHSRLENVSNQERLNQFKDTGDIVEHNFFTGVGMSSYSPSLYSHETNKRQIWTYQPVHNVYLLVLSEIGIFGFLAFFAIFIYFFKKTLENKQFFDLFLILSILFMFLFDHWLWTFHFGLIFMFFVLGFIFRNSKIMNN